MANEKIERRSCSAQLRAAKDADAFQITGLAAAYNVESADLGGFKEVVAPGAFTRALREKQDVRCLYNHSTDHVPLGRVGNGTLKLEDSATGLRFTCQLNPESEAHRNVFAAIKRGDISQCSFSFITDADGQKWEHRYGSSRRTLTDLKRVLDVSAVCYPAYPTGTSVEARGIDYALPASIADMEWEAIKNKIRAIGMTILQERSDKVTDMTLRAEVERIEREARRDRVRARLQRALLGLDVED